ncbi:MAG TPA: I78 family peptidase inhibitor [Sphingomicrobium sp.]|nr:I78 family peptidase inhibitor [Sphingomicrobium sp.]
MIILAALTLAACSAAPPEGPAPLPAGSCHDDTLTTFVGQDATPEIGGTLMRQSGARVLRWVPKGSMITMEFSADRLTVYLDANNKIEKLSCG